MRTPFLFLTLGLAALAFGCGKKKEVLSPSEGCVLKVEPLVD